MATQPNQPPPVLGESEVPPPAKPRQESAPLGGRWAWIVPNLTVFISSLCIMVVELVAGRLIARHVGSSLYTWTSVIGIVLAGIAAGNYAGGRLADRYRAREALASLFLLASAACLLIPLFNERIGTSQLLRTQGWATRIALHVFFVFFLPSAMMGTISPVAAKMALEMSRQTGRTVGSIYSWGAVGSIVGTFLTGYFLIARMGTVAVLLCVAAVLLLMALFFGAKTLAPYIWSGVVLACIFVSVGPWAWTQTIGMRLGLRERTGKTIHFQEESHYSFIRIEDEPEMEGDTRSLTMDFLIHAYIDLANPDRLQYDYEQVYAGLTELAARDWPAERKPRALSLGGGGFVFPRWMLRRWPGAYIEVAELDPDVTRAAHEAFGLSLQTPLHIFNLDARNHVDNLLMAKQQGADVGRFDFVYGDAFNHYSPPFHLTTYEFNEKVRRLMNPDGLFLANVIDIYRSGKFLGAMLNTFEKSFQHVYVLGTTLTQPNDEDGRDTFVVVGTNRPLPFEKYDWIRYPGPLLEAEQLATLRERSGGLVLTDDFAPVDNLLEPVIRYSEKR
jgi:spermidine synthase